MTNNIYEISEKGTKYILPLHFSTLEAGLQHCNHPEAGLHGNTLYSGGGAARQYSGGVVTEVGLLCLCSPVISS